MTPLEFIRDILHDLIWAIPVYIFMYILYQTFYVLRSFITKITTIIEQVIDSIQIKKYKENNPDIIEIIVKRIIDADNNHMQLPVQHALHKMSPITKLLNRLLTEV